MSQKQSNVKHKNFCFQPLPSPYISYTEISMKIKRIFSWMIFGFQKMFCDQAFKIVKYTQDMIKPIKHTQT